METIQSKKASYQLQSQLGSGSYSVVKKARNVTTGENCAIKIMSKDHIKTIGAEEHILAEIRFLMKFKHENIINMLDYFEDEENIYIVMELCANGDLSQLKLPLSEQQIFHILYQVVDALRYLHERQMIHRDLKPTNILINENNVIKLIDFNWAVTYKSDIGGVICGTIEFMPPEVLQYYIHTPKIDIWSLGITFYVLLLVISKYLLFGFLPFRGKDIHDTIQQILTQNPFHNCAKYPADMMILMMSMLNKNHAQRPTIHQVIENAWFQRLLSQITFSTSADSNQEELYNTKKKPKKSRSKSFIESLFSQGSD